MSIPNNEAGQTRDDKKGRAGDSFSPTSDQERSDILARIIECASDYIGACDPDGRTLMINPAGRKLIGLAADESPEGRPITDWHPQADNDMLRNLALPHAIEKGSWLGKIAVLTRDGREIPMSAQITGHRDSADELTSFSIVARDITRQVENEANLLKEKQFLQKTIDSLFAFVGVCTPEGILIEANRPALEAAGVQPEDVLGKPFPETYWWAYDKDVQERLWQAIDDAAAGKVSRYDVKVRLAEGELIPIDFQLTPLMDDDGTVTHLIPSGTDLSDRVEIESEMRVFRRAFESSLTAMLITDPAQPDNPIVYVNPGFEKMMGYSSEDAIGKNCRFLQGPETDPIAVGNIREKIKQGQMSTTTILNYRKDGTKFWNELEITPVRDDDGNLTHFVGMQFDMTKHREAEERMARARDVAEAANAAKSAFVANVSHEMRTPLTTVVGMTELLLDQETDQQKHETLQMIYQSGKHLVTLINDVLDLSKIEAGKLEADFLDVSPQRIIDDVAASMSYRAKEKGLEFQFQYNGLIPDRIKTDPIRMRQILFNLAGNAVKFTEKGSVTLVTSVIDRESDPKLQIVVQDTGVGFDSKAAKKLFQKFSQIDESPTRRQGGTGLGLYISKRLAELLGGTIAANSKIGQGSRFTLTLPTGDMAERTLIDPVTHEEPQPKPHPADEKFEIAGKVLVVEDTRGIRVMLRRMLENAGAKVEEAADGRLAIETIEQELSQNGNSTRPFDLIVLDMHMPRLSGYETAKRLREMGIETPIIALTASAMRGDREKCLSAGCDDYLTKPVDRAKLLTKVVSLTTR